MSLSSVSKISVILLVVGLVVGGGGGYVVSSSLMQSRINEYEVEISDLTSELSRLTSTVFDLEAEISNYETELSDLEDQISSSEAQVSSLEAQVFTLESQVSSLEDEISDLESKLSDEQSTISDYEDQIAYLESQVSSLKRVLEGYVPDLFTIGMTATSIQSLDSVQAVAAIAKKDINKYCQEEGYPFTFDFNVSSNYGDPNYAVENTIWFNNLGVNLIVGHETDRETILSLQYVNTHKMVMISPSATAQELAKSNDNLYRTCPTYLTQTIVMAEAMARWGIKAVVVIQRGDEWGDGVYYAFKDEFEARGGVMYKRIRYDVGTINFGGYLNQAEAASVTAIDEYGGDRVAIVLISLDKADNIVAFSRNYDTIYGLIWFGTESTARNSNLFKNIPEEADKLKIFSPLVALEENDAYARFADDYSSIMGQKPDFYTSAMYDACWLYALSIMKTWTAETSYVKQELYGIAANYYGASGWLRLNDDGDRYAVDYDIWGYELKAGQLIEVLYGYYDSVNDEVTWFEDTGINPPG